MLRRLFDYIFYRFGKAYYKWDRRSAITAICALTFMQSLWIAIFIMVPARLIYPLSVTSKYTKISGFLMGVLMLVIYHLNEKRYADQYNKIKTRYVDESHVFIKGILVIVAVFSPVAIIIVCVNKLKPLW
jgi:hypothetical protein